MGLRHEARHIQPSLPPSLPASLPPSYNSHLPPSFPIQTALLFSCAARSRFQPGQMFNTSDNMFLFSPLFSMPGCNSSVLPTRTGPTEILHQSRIKVILLLSLALGRVRKSLQNTFSGKNNPNTKVQRR